MKSNTHPRYLGIILFVFFFIQQGISTFTYAQTKIEGLSYIDNLPISIEIENGYIKTITHIESLPKGPKKVYIAPGLFDNQVNGGNEIYFAASKGINLADVRTVTRNQWSVGVTTYLPTLTSNSKEVFLQNLTVLSQAFNDPEIKGSIGGIHLEGPYISPVEGFRGAHSPKYIRKADWTEFMDFYNTSGRHIVTVTIAPETDGAIEFIRKCTEMKIVMALGHHNASSQLIEDAVEAGACICTHLGNGCANMINRHENPLWPQLARNKLMVSLICDGFHLNDDEIKVFYGIKGTERTIITSDITSLAGLTPGTYKTADGKELELTESGKVQYPAQKVLAGSALSLNVGVKHLMDVTLCSLAEAIRMGSTNPARLYGFTDRGELKPGMRADLILFTIGDKKLDIEKTYVDGELVFSIAQ